MSYTDSGVDLKAAASVKERIARTAGLFRYPSVLTGPGEGFAGVFSAFKGSPYPLAASVDSVGTKVRIARLLKRWDTIGRDIVNHCVNDILCSGAEPLFFLDYIGCGELESQSQMVEDIVSGLAEACKDAGCPLLGGETAIMPDFYTKGDIDLVGFIVGLVKHPRDLSGLEGRETVFALPSSGLHTNGYSLVRKALGIEEMPERLTEWNIEGLTLGEALLEPHRSYFELLRPYFQSTLNPIAHITGGGLRENIARVLPSDIQVNIDDSSWVIPLLFNFIQEEGRIETTEMFRVFNMGIGVVGFLAHEEEYILKEMPDAIVIGETRSRPKGGQPVRIESLD